MIPPIAYVIAGAVVVIALARFQPRIAGWVLLSLVLLMLLTAQQRAGVA